MEGLIDQFHSIVKDFRLKRHDLLAYHNNKFDRDYVEFNVKISDLECSLQASLIKAYMFELFCFLLAIAAPLANPTARGALVVTRRTFSSSGAKSPLPEYRCGFQRQQFGPGEQVYHLSLVQAAA